MSELAVDRRTDMTLRFSISENKDYSLGLEKQDLYAQKDCILTLIHCLATHALLHTHAHINTGRNSFCAMSF